MAGERRSGLAVAGSTLLAAIFVATCWPFLRMPMGVDTLGFYWMVKHLPAWSLVTDPLSAGYTFVFFFEPVLVYLHYVDLWTEPWLGAAAHHVGALVGALAAAAVLARMVYRASGNLGQAGGAVALFLFSAVTWFDVGYTPMVHYTFCTLFSLLALSPSWDERFGGAAGSGANLKSALWYGLAVGAKESAAALPLVIFVMRWQSGRRPLQIVGSLVPHGVALALLVGWRHFILGGMGGYFYVEEVWGGQNLARSVWALAESLWNGHALVVASAAGLSALWLRTAAVPLALLAYLASILPFFLTAPLPIDLFAGGRLILSWALLLLFLVPGRRSWGGSLLAVALLIVQLQGWPRTAAGIWRQLPEAAAQPEAAEADGVMVSYSALWHALDHQLRAQPKSLFQAYITPTEVALAAALGEAPAGAAGDATIPRVEPLDMSGIDISADERGRFHLRIADERFRRSGSPPLYLALDYRNGTTRWLAAFGAARRRIDFPLNPSIRAVILFDPRQGASWPVFEWKSPFFTDPFPPQAL